MDNIYLVVEEPETGYYGECDNHTTLSAHRTEAGAKAAVRRWRASHEGPRGETAHAFETASEAEHWCACGLGVHTEFVELSD
ncbi:MAG: hypothetical protein KJ067_09480 [Vicinamibacteria bacterium]|jgi:hypothetical protein|nr:hypothetical protein [Vicinamibacteria bacterium]